ncbi:MAG: hypothetical protein AAFY13_04410, partial [Pseudomonadota bacterium]
ALLGPLPFLSPLLSPLRGPSSRLSDVLENVLANGLRGPGFDGPPGPLPRGDRKSLLIGVA